LVWPSLHGSTVSIDGSFGHRREETVSSITVGPITRNSNMLWWKALHRCQQTAGCPACHGSCMLTRLGLIFAGSVSCVQRMFTW